jgi:urease accessory protein
MATSELALLRLIQFSDSALPIGGAAHSFGLESLVAEGRLTVEDLPAFLEDYLQEAGCLEAVFCRLAHACWPEQANERAGGPDGPIEEGGAPNRQAQWLRLNRQLSAFRGSRESREASATLGRRFLQLAVSITESPALAITLERSVEEGVEVHLCTAFGQVGAFLGLDPQTIANCYLHQSLAGLISACQRLLPLGQNQASRLLWDLKPSIVSTVERSLPLTLEAVSCFLPALDVASMGHPVLATRLFVS